MSFRVTINQLFILYLLGLSIYCYDMFWEDGKLSTEPDRIDFVNNTIQISVVEYGEKTLVSRKVYQLEPDFIEFEFSYIGVPPNPVFVNINETFFFGSIEHFSGIIPDSGIHVKIDASASFESRSYVTYLINFGIYNGFLNTVVTIDPVTSMFSTEDYYSLGFRLLLPALLVIVISLVAYVNLLELSQRSSGYIGNQTFEENDIISMELYFKRIKPIIKYSPVMFLFFLIPHFGFGYALLVLIAGSYTLGKFCRMSNIPIRSYLTLLLPFFSISLGNRVSAKVVIPYLKDKLLHFGINSLISYPFLCLINILFWYISINSIEGIENNLELRKMLYKIIGALLLSVFIIST
ncbi:MAG: hypothetical protein INQ03_13650 [Candidatus Heimdallarchaeota archaeon]|nr:hypothetical protein [Candidatus Heimdallarchaeota archaeon]